MPLRDHQPPGIPRMVGDIARRLGALEREKNAAAEWEDVGTGGTGAGGIQFDTYPQAGGWLYVETTDATGSPHGYDFEFRAAGDVGILPQGSIVAEAFHGNVTIEADDGFVKIQADTTDVIVFAQRFLNMEGDTSIALNSLGTIGIDAPGISIGSGAFVYNASGSGSVTVTSGSITFVSSSQRTTCTTLAQVIALLVSYGLAV